MSTNELNEVKLVLQSGKEFEFVGVFINEKKRDRKKEEKEEAAEGIDVTKFVVLRHSKKGNILLVDLHDFKGCSFKTIGGGSNTKKAYTC